MDRGPARKGRREDQGVGWMIEIEIESRPGRFRGLAFSIGLIAPLQSLDQGNFLTFLRLPAIG